MLKTWRRFRYSATRLIVRRTVVRWRCPDIRKLSIFSRLALKDENSEILAKTRFIVSKLDVSSLRPIHSASESNRRERSLIEKTFEAIWAIASRRRSRRQLEKIRVTTDPRADPPVFLLQVFRNLCMQILEILECVVLENWAARWRKRRAERCLASLANWAHVNFTTFVANFNRLKALFVAEYLNLPRATTRLEDSTIFLSATPWRNFWTAEQKWPSLALRARKKNTFLAKISFFCMFNSTRSLWIYKARFQATSPDLKSLLFCWELISLILFEAVTFRARTSKALRYIRCSRNRSAHFRAEAEAFEHLRSSLKAAKRIRWFLDVWRLFKCWRSRSLFRDKALSAEKIRWSLSVWMMRV